MQLDCVHFSAPRLICVYVPESIKLKLKSSEIYSLTNNPDLLLFHITKVSQLHPGSIMKFYATHKVWHRNENASNLHPPNLPGLVEKWNDIFSLDLFKKYSAMHTIGRHSLDSLRA